MLREELAELDRRILIKKENIKLLRLEIGELTDDKTRVEIKRNVKNHNHIWGTSYDTNV
jgi:hypothetical protein